MAILERIYLQTCFEAFGEVSAKMYGTPFDLSAIEHDVQHLRRDTPLSYKDLRYFESPERWWFKRFWVFPPREDLDEAAAGRTFNFWQLGDKNERAIIQALLEVFRSIELSSIILRFIRPDRYGIIS